MASGSSVSAVPGDSITASSAAATLGAAGSAGASAGKPGTPLHDWLEAEEAYCATERYFLGRHSACFDALRAYYAADVALFGLPTCASVAR
jgi:hypothetical protein